MEKLNISGRAVGEGEPPYVIAELGANHNGDMDLCLRLIDAAQDSGADAVKFQSWSKSSLISAAEYQRSTIYAAHDPSAMTLEQSVERYQLTPAQLQEIATHCRERGITWFSSCFSFEEVDLMENLKVPTYKIASMDVNHLPLLRCIARTGKPVLLSTGMATLGEVERALFVLREGGAGPVALLHCVSLYPSPPETVNLRMIETWRRAFDVQAGYSDHTLGVAAPLGAIALGASVIEKHFTLDTGLPGWDHAISADPDQMRALVEGARLIHAALGSPVRVVGAAEMDKRKVFRRRMVAKRSLPQGHRVTSADLDFKRPGTGIAPDELDYALGRALRRAVVADEELDWEDFA